MNPIDFEIDDLPENLRHMAEIIGLHSTKKLMIEFAGTDFKFPVHYPPAIIKSYLRAHYNGKNARALGNKLGVSRQTVFRYLNEKIKTIPV